MQNSLYFKSSIPKTPEYLMNIDSAVYIIFYAGCIHLLLVVKIKHTVLSVGEINLVAFMKNFELLL